MNLGVLETARAPSGRVKNDVKTIQLRARKVKKKGVAIVNFGTNKRRSNSLSSSIVKSTSDSAKISVLHKLQCLVCIRAVHVTVYDVNGPNYHESLESIRADRCAVKAA